MCAEIYFLSDFSCKINRSKWEQLFVIRLVLVFGETQTKVFNIHVIRSTTLAPCHSLELKVVLKPSGHSLRSHRLTLIYTLNLAIQPYSYLRTLMPRHRIASAETYNRFNLYGRCTSSSPIHFDNKHRLPYIRLLSDDHSFFIVI